METEVTPPVTTVATRYGKVQAVPVDVLSLVSGDLVVVDGHVYSIVLHPEGTPPGVDPAGAFHVQITLEATADVPDRPRLRHSMWPVSRPILRVIPRRRRDSRIRGALRAYGRWLVRMMKGTASA